MSEKSFEKRDIVMFRAFGNIMMAQIKDGGQLVNGEKFRKLHSPRVLIIQSDQQSGKMHMTLLPYAVISSKALLSDLVDNDNFSVLFNTDLIECEIPREQIGNDIINRYIATMSPIEVPTVFNEQIADLKDVAKQDLGGFQL